MQLEETDDKLGARRVLRVGMEAKWMKGMSGKEKTFFDNTKRENKGMKYSHVINSLFKTERSS